MKDLIFGEEGSDGLEEGVEMRVASSRGELTGKRGYRIKLDMKSCIRQISR